MQIKKYTHEYDVARAKLAHSPCKFVRWLHTTLPDGTVRRESIVLPPLAYDHA
jgi:hypothetical protein